MQTYGLLFYPKKKKGNSEMSIVYMRITVDGKRIEVSSGRTIKTKEWNTSEEEIIHMTGSENRLNRELKRHRY